MRDFDGVGQAIAKMIGVAAREDLSLRFQTSEGAGMDHSVAVALKIVAVGMGRFGMAASAGIFYVDGVVGELGVGGQLRYPVASLPLEYKVPGDESDSGVWLIAVCSQCQRVRFRIFPAKGN